VNAAATKTNRLARQFCTEDQRGFAAIGDSFNLAQWTLLIINLSAINGVKSQLEPIRSSHLVEDSEQIITNRVLTQIELMGNVSIGEAFGHQVDHTFFPLR
jgi:hypothetical protein